MQDVPLQQSRPMGEVELIAAIDDSDNRSYGSNLSNLTAALSAERDISRLLESILVAAKTITRADGGTLYRVTEDRCLRFEILRTTSLQYYLGGTTGHPVPFYPIQLYADGKPNHTMIADRKSTRLNSSH